MAVIKHRPALRLKVPRDIRPGSRIRVEVVVEARREVSIDWLDIRFDGVERTVFGSGKNQHTYTNGICALHARLAGKGKIAPGNHSFPCELPLPPNIPPSYGHPRTSTEVEYEATVRASIPWWPDAKEAFAVRVLSLEREPEEEEPVLFASLAAGPHTTEPYIEGSLAARSFCPGEVIEGVVSVFNTAYNPYRAIEISLVATELVRRKPDGGATRREGDRWTLRVPIEHLEEGMSVPFRMRTDAGITSSFAGGIVSLGWAFEVRAKNSVLKPDPVAFIPITVLPPPVLGKARERRLHAPPSVGSDRMTKIWQHVAGQAGLAYEGGKLQGQHGEVTFEVRREHRGPDGIYLVGDLRYPSLHLALDGGLATGFRRLVGGGVHSGFAAWDRAHYVTGREARQVESFVRALGATLTALEVADMEDEHLVAQHRDAGIRLKPLVGFVESVQALAAQLPIARTAVLPPEALEDAMPGWMRLANRLDEGKVFTARPSVEGRLAGAPVEVFVDWTPEGEARRTGLRLLTGTPTDAEHRFLWVKGEPAPPTLSRLSREARALVESLVEESMGLSVGESELLLSLPGVLDDPVAALPRLHELARLAAALRGEGGPYR